MKNIVKTSSKLGLIAALLLLAAACGGEENQRDPLPKEAASPLVKIAEIPPGNQCEHGGTLIVNGLDKDKNGELSESEIVSRTPVCKSAPGNGSGGENTSSPLIKTETLDVGDADCPGGGQRIIAGVDLDEDDELSANEIKSTTLLCNEVGACSGAVPLEIVNAEFEQDIYNQHEIGQEYEIRVELNQAIDKNRVNFHDAAGALGDGPLAYQIDADNDHIAILKWTPNKSGSAPFLALIEDGCSLIASDGQLPYASEPAAQVRVTSNVGGLLNEGDKAEVCWTSRNTDKCEFFEFNNLVGPIELNGCMDIELTAAHIADQTTTMINYSIHCEGNNAPNGTTSHSSSAPLFKTPILQYFYGQSPMMLADGGGPVTMYWHTFGMTSCELSDGTTSNPVDFSAPHNAPSPFTTNITESTTFELKCEDVLNQTHSREVYFLVGPGILYLDGGIYAPQQSLSVAWQSIDLDGTCDVKYSNNGQTLVYNDQNQGAAQNQDGFSLRSSSIYIQNINMGLFDLTKDQVIDLTCYNADKSKSYSKTFIK